MIEQVDEGPLCLGMVELLIERGVRLDGPRPRSRFTNWSYPRTATLWAIHRDKLDVASQLIAAGAPVPDRSAMGHRFVRGSYRIFAHEGDVLDRAIDEGHLRLVEQLLEAGFDSDLADEFRDRDDDKGTGRLARATWLGRRDVIEALLDAGASLTEPPNGVSPLLVAAMAGDAELHDWLLEQGAPPSPHALAALGREEALLGMLDDSDIDVPDGRLRWSPLAWAAAAGDGELVQALLERGADPNPVLPGAGRGPLPWASETGTLPPDRNRVKEGSALSVHCVRRGQFDLAKLLVSRGAAVTEPGGVRKANAAESVSDSPAAPRTLAEKRDRAWQAVLRQEPERLLRLLEEAGEHREELTAWIADKASWRSGVVVSALLDAGVIRINTDEEKARLLSRQTHSPKIVARLLAAGAKAQPDVAERYGWLPLHDACSSCNPESIRLLLEAGANPNLRTHDGKATIEVLFNGLYRSRRSELDERLVDCVRILLEFGADPMKASYANPMLFEDAHYEEMSDETRAAIDELMRPYAEGYLD